MEGCSGRNRLAVARRLRVRKERRDKTDDILGYYMMYLTSIIFLFQHTTEAEAADRHLVPWEEWIGIETLCEGNTVRGAKRDGYTQTVKRTSDV